MRPRLTPEQIETIKSLYVKGHSSTEIKESLGLLMSDRQIQRIIKKAGLTRSKKDAFRLAIVNGRVTYHTNPLKDTVRRKKINSHVRYKVLVRDNFRCVTCGAGADTARLQVDHVDENKNNNDEINLQTLCEHCNKGKAVFSGKNWSPTRRPS